MSDARIIKRYANRKLYDTQHSRYVTLDQIAEMIRNGDDVKIIDNKSKEDLTSVTLAQIIFEEEKKQKSFLPLQAMRNIIQSGGESITQLVTQAQKKASQMFKKDGDADDDADDGNSEPEAPAGGVLNTVELREWIATSQRRIDEWQKKLDGRIRHVVEGVTTPFSNLQKDLMSLRQRIADLEQKLRPGSASSAGSTTDTDAGGSSTGN